MLKQILHKGFSALMAILVLFSTVSFTVEKHFCGDNLIDVAVFTEADKCGENMEQTSKKSCCKDEIEVVIGQDELQIASFESITFETQLFVATFASTYINLFEGLPRQINPFKDYSPPNLVFDIQVLDQVFLI